MMERKIQNTVKGFRTQDGDGVNLVRVLSRDTINEFDPILMLDSFDSTNPEDYAGGFPMHPHRGIETVSLIVNGNMKHKDSLGNEDSISDGEVQWMTAGSGIMHEETLPASDRMLGVQLWLNLPQADKMTKPEYKSIKTDEIEEIKIDGGKLRLISGEYQTYKGFTPKYLPLDFYQIILEPNKKYTLETGIDRSVMLFTLIGSAKVAGQVVDEKTAVKLTDGTFVDIESLDEELQILFISSEKLEEPVAWGGPIVMNSSDEIQGAFSELQNGTFIKEGVDY